MSDLVNPFATEGNWYKANLHTHTNASDGAATLEEAVRRYRLNEYNVLAITDHHATSDVSGLSDEAMLVISGFEYHPPIPGRDKHYHFVGLNIPHGFEFNDGPDPGDCIHEVAEAGGMTILAHPHWCGLEYEDFRHFEEIVAMEVWNAACDPAGRPDSENEWAYALDRGWKLPAIAVDDTHWRDEGDLFAGWTWLKMTSLTTENVLKAIRTGACYASRGPKIRDFRVEDGRVSIRCSPVERIYFISSPDGGGKRHVAPPDKTIDSFSIEVPDFWPYVRAAVADSRGRRAWTNPIWL